MTPLDETSTSISCLIALPTNETDDSLGTIVSGDFQGVIRIWKARRIAGQIHFQETLAYQLIPSEEDGTSSSCAIQNMTALSDGRIAISTAKVDNANARSNSVTPVMIPSPQAVNIMDTSSGTIAISLDGHKDVVSCICELPNGDLLTAGGRFDATTQRWKSSKWIRCNEENDESMIIDQDSIIRHTKSDETLGDVGYVLSLVVLPDALEGSSHFALAAARYNVVKVVL